MPNKLKISEQDIEFSHEVKYLGVTLDSKMIWDVHFSNVIKRAKQYLFMLKKAVYKTWGPKPILIKWIYTAIVRPRIRCTPIVPNFKAPALPKKWGSNNSDRAPKIHNFLNISIKPLSQIPDMRL